VACCQGAAESRAGISAKRRHSRRYPSSAGQKFGIRSA
jgi:hypothetical protein